MVAMACCICALVAAVPEKLLTGPVPVGEPQPVDCAGAALPLTPMAPVCAIENCPPELLKKFKLFELAGLYTTHSVCPDWVTVIAFN